MRSARASRCSSRGRWTGCRSGSDRRGDRRAALARGIGAADGRQRGDGPDKPRRPRRSVTPTQAAQGQAATRLTCQSDRLLALSNRTGCARSGLKTVRPLHGWREFFGEVGRHRARRRCSLLGAQQVVQDIQTRDDRAAPSARRSIIEIGLNLFVYEVRARQVGRDAKRAADLKDWLAPRGPISRVGRAIRRVAQAQRQAARRLNLAPERLSAAAS